LRNLQQHLNENPIVAMPSDVTRELNFRKHFQISIPDREQWLPNSPLPYKEGDIVWYTDGSKKDGQAGAGVHGVRPMKKFSISLGRHPTVFQTELFAIFACAHENMRRHYKNKRIFILSDSQAALKDLNSVEINSKLTLECIRALNSIGECNNITLMWVPGHSNIEGNEAADELARLGAETAPIGPEPYCGLPKCAPRNELRSRAQNQSITIWQKAPGQHHAKELLKGYSPKFTSDLLKLSRNQVRVITRALTGHCRLNKHLTRMGLSESPSCRFCSVEDETPIHILCKCDALHHRRSRSLGGPLIRPEDVRELAPYQIARFFRDLGLGEEI
jgi:ribonuclease HI